MPTPPAPATMSKSASVPSRDENVKVSSPSRTYRRFRLKHGISIITTSKENSQRSLVPFDLNNGCNLSNFPKRQPDTVEDDCSARCPSSPRNSKRSRHVKTLAPRKEPHFNSSDSSEVLTTNLLTLTLISPRCSC